MKAATVIGTDSFAVVADPMGQLPVVLVKHGRAMWTTESWLAEQRDARPGVVLCERDASALAGALGVDVDTARKGLLRLIGRAR